MVSSIETPLYMTLLKKLARPGCITQGSLAEIPNQTFSLKYQTFWQLAAAFMCMTLFAIYPLTLLVFRTVSPMSSFTIGHVGPLQSCYKGNTSEIGHAVTFVNTTIGHVGPLQSCYKGNTSEIGYAVTFVNTTIGHVGPLQSCYKGNTSEIGHAVTFVNMTIGHVGPLQCDQYNSYIPLRWFLMVFRRLSNWALCKLELPDPNPIDTS